MGNPIARDQRGRTTVSDEEPPVGVIVTAFLIFFGGFVPLLFGIGAFFGAADTPSYAATVATPVQDVILRADQYLSATEITGVGLWGLITGVGLINLRAWARASVIAFSGLVIPFYLSFILMAAVDPERSGFSTGFQVALLALVFFPGWAAVGWTIYFNLREVRERFEASRAGAWANIDSKSASGLNVRPQRGAGVILATSVYIAGSTFFLLALLRAVPATLFGKPLEGAAAGTLNAAACAGALAVAAGLLRLRPWARAAAIVGCELGLVNWYAFTTMPRAGVHVAAVLDGVGVRIPANLAPALLPVIIDLSTFILLLLSLAVLGSLVSSRRAFAQEVAQ